MWALVLELQEKTRQQEQALKRFEEERQIKHGRNITKSRDWMNHADLRDKHDDIMIPEQVPVL